MKMTISNFQVTGMTCGHCESAVKKEVSELSGVTAVEVSSATGKLTVTADRELSDSEVIAAVDEAGYEATRA